MAKPSTFRVLLLFIDGELAFRGRELADELLPDQVLALTVAGLAPGPKSFLLLALRNWQLETRTRRVRLPRELQGLCLMPEREAVERLLGHEDGGGRWHPGLAGLTAMEARVWELRVIDRRSVAEVAWALSLRDQTVKNYMAEARRKLRGWFGLEVLPCEPSGLAPRLVPIAMAG